MIKIRKIAIIGIGHVGSHCAYSLITQGICDELILIDVDQKKVAGHAADLEDAVTYLPHRVRISVGQIGDCSDADIIVISAGAPRKENQTRLDVMDATVEIFKTLIPTLIDLEFNGILINLSNPADVMTYYLQTKTGFPSNKVFSTSTMLDSARLKKVLSRETGIDPKSISAYVLGEHGDSQMVSWSNASVGGKLLIELMEQNPKSYGKINLEDIAYRAKAEGGLILSGKDFTEFGIGTALTELVKTIFHDENKVLPVSVLLEGQYSQSNIYASVPAIVGKNGIQEIIELTLSPEEQEAFNTSCSIMRKNYERALEL